jgi:hypothetical protein
LFTGCCLWFPCAESRLQKFQKASWELTNGISTNLSRRTCTSR